MTTPSRFSRALLCAICAAAAALLLTAPGAAAAARGFELGVTAAEVDSDSAILWAKAKRSGAALLQLERRGGFGGCDLAGAPANRLAEAKRRNDNTVQRTARKLEAGTKYRYRFCMRGGAHSDTGRFETAPSPRQRKTIRFAFSGDQDALPAPGASEPYWNDFGIWDEIRRQRNDFNVLLGDTIYSDTEVPGYGLDDVALSVEDKWRKYEINLRERSWSKARGAAAYYAHWDDHEFINDFSREEDVFPLGVGDVNIDGEKLYRRGVRAFQDYNPVTLKRRTGIFRSVRWGKNLEIFFLDERSFRSQSADYQGACDNPPGSGDPDLAPTAPQSTRNTFSAIVPQLSNPPPPGCLERINDPNRTLLGEAQLAKFKRAIKRSEATFKVIFNEVPIQQYYALPYDRWEGYEAERQEVLRFLAEKVDNVVFLTTDVHANLVNDARYCTLEANCPQNSGILEATTGPIATATYSEEIEGAIGNPSGGALIHDAFFKPPPPDGVGMRCAATDQFSYSQVEVSKTRLRIDLLDINGDPVLDTGDREAPGATPCAPIMIPKQ